MPGGAAGGVFATFCWRRRDLRRVYCADMGGWDEEGVVGGYGEDLQYAVVLFEYFRLDDERGVAQRKWPLRLSPNHYPSVEY